MVEPWYFGLRSHNYYSEFKQLQVRILLAVTLSNISQFSKLLYCWEILKYFIASLILFPALKKFKKID